MIMKHAIFALILLTSQLLMGCTPMGMAMTAGASTGVAVAQDKTIGQSFDDTKIKLHINEQLFQTNVEMFRHMNVIVDEGRVLLIGYVDKPELIEKAVEIAWNTKGVQDVMNEVEVSKGEGFARYAQDSVITTKLKTKLTFDKHVHAVNYNITTLKGVVYIIGIAQNDEELSHVTNHARNIRFVKKVVNYVRVKPAES